MLHSPTEKTNPAMRYDPDTAVIGTSTGRVRVGLALAARLLSAAKGLTTWFTAMQRRATSPRRLELIETLPLGARRQLFVVMCDNQRYLVGAGAESVGTIVPIETRSKPPEKAAKGPLLVRERHRDAGRIMSAEPVRRKSFEAISETGDLWQ